jgi:hypothetical protein
MWKASYQRRMEPPDRAQASVEAPTRKEALRLVRQFLIGHGQCIFSNLFEDVDAAE